MLYSNNYRYTKEKLANPRNVCWFDSGILESESVTLFYVKIQTGNSYNNFF